ncbi:MAG: hypothetical protein ACFFE2_11875 [Candidatus Thorarchaeota archaeon]
MQGLMGLLYQIGIGILLSGISFTFGFLYRNLRKFLEFREYTEVFGKIAENQGNIHICIPLWKIKPEKREVKRYQKERIDGIIEEYHGPDNMVSLGDHEAGTHIEHVIAEFQEATVEYCLDNDKEFDCANRTVIMLGSPIANSRARLFFKQYPPPYFEFEITEETSEHDAALTIKDKKSPTEFNSVGDTEYSVILRTPNPHDKDGFFFFVFGAHANGTTVAALFLKNNWKKFTKALESAVVLLKMPRNSTAYEEVKEFSYGFYD